MAATGRSTSSRPKRAWPRTAAAAYTYEYNLTDHLGKVCASFDIYGGAVRMLQRDDYYPDYAEYGAKASQWLEKNVPHWKELF
jgi:hypothetical protein